MRRPPKWLPVGLLAIFGALLGISFWLAGVTSASPADWFSALTTGGALVAALLAAWYIARAYDIEQKREHDRDWQDARAQAELVAAWSGPIRPTMYPDPDGTGEEVPAIPEIAATVWNGSALPVYDLRVHFRICEVEHGDWSRPSNVVSTGQLGDSRHPLVPPALGAGRIAYCPGVTDRDPVYLLDEVVDLERLSIEVAIGFRDASNREWFRGFDGRLRFDGNTVRG